MASSKRGRKKKVAILIVAYNAVSTLRQVLDRIPEEVWEKVAEVCVFDDSSGDDTYLVGLGYKAHHGKAKLSVFRNEQNLGYGGNQIRGYRYAIDQGHDIVALLHGDGQYAPEALPVLLDPIEKGEADAVFGSRMMPPGDPLKGGMPLYKYLGNRVLSSLENAALGMSLSEFHSGYRVYSCEALKRLPFEKNTNEFHFDTQIIVQMHAAGMRIVEKPIPTFYGDEISHVNGLKYARDIVRTVAEYKLHELGIQHYPVYEVTPTYHLKTSPLASHHQLMRMVGAERRSVLDIGCSRNELGRALRQAGHRVTGIDERPPPFELDAFHRADLAKGLLDTLPERFDIVLMSDVLEHVKHPDRLLKQACSHLAEGGKILLSLPNVVHWSIRTAMAFGKFDYTNKGILDRSHLRFFTRETARRLFREAGLRVTEERSTPVPWENVVSGGVLRDLLEKADHLLGELDPNLFAYQYVYELQPVADR
jgi:glycosyltransferase involved in cell wall biosynthesis